MGTVTFLKDKELFSQTTAVCLLSWRYKPLWLYFPQPGRGLQSPRFRGFLITHNDAPQSYGRVINPSQRPLPDNTQHSQQTNIHAPRGIGTHDLCRRAAEDLRLRPRGHWDRQTNYSRNSIYPEAGYPDRQLSGSGGPLGKFVKKSTKLTCLEITGYRIKYSTVLWLPELRIRRGLKV
jgi:hypothetical protein